MKRRMTRFLLGGVMILSLLMSACGSSGSEKMAEYKELGITQMESGDYESAVQSFQKALDQSLGSIGAEELDICYYKALALYKSGDADGAIEAYTALIDYDSKNWEVYYLRGNVYLAEGQEEEALADYAQAASLHDDAELFVNIYENLADAGLAESGQTYMEKVLSITPSDAEEYYFVGDMYYLIGDYENTKTNLLAAQEAGYDKALLLLGVICANEGDSASAQTYFSAYMEKYPEDAQALNELGESALEAADYEDAVTYLECALEAGDTDMEMIILKNLIIAYEYSGDFESAYDIAKQFLASYSDEEIEREYIFLETRVGEDIEAPSEDDTETEDADTSGENVTADEETDTSGENVTADEETDASGESNPADGESEAEENADDVTGESDAAE